MTTEQIVKHAAKHAERRAANQAFRQACKMTEADLVEWLDSLAPEKAGSTDAFELNPVK